MASLRSLLLGATIACVAACSPTEDVGSPPRDTRRVETSRREPGENPRRGIVRQAWSHLDSSRVRLPEIDTVTTAHLSQEGSAKTVAVVEDDYDGPPSIKLDADYVESLSSDRSTAVRRAANTLSHEVGHVKTAGAPWSWMQIKQSIRSNTESGFLGDYWTHASVFAREQLRSRTKYGTKDPGELAAEIYRCATAGDTPPPLSSLAARWDEHDILTSMIEYGRVDHAEVRDDFSPAFPAYITNVYGEAGDDVQLGRYQHRGLATRDDVAEAVEEILGDSYSYLRGERLGFVNAPGLSRQCFDRPADEDMVLYNPSCSLDGGAKRRQYHSVVGSDWSDAVER